MQYDQIAQDYAESVFQDLDHDKLTSEMLTLTGIANPSGWRILDVGCGSGIQLQFLARQYSSIRSLIGIDSSRELIRLAKHYNRDDRCEYTTSDMHHLDLADNLFDFIYSRYTVHYSLDVAGVLQEMFRVAKPGGTIFIQVVHPIYEMYIKTSHNYSSSQEATFTIHPLGTEVRHYTHMVSEYVNAALQSGLKLQDIEERYGAKSDIDGFRIPTVLIVRLTKE